MNEDPAGYAVELIVKAMPGFESQIDADRGRIIFRGPFYLGGRLGLEQIYPVPSGGVFGVEAWVAEIVEQTQRAGIRALGLEPVIAADIERARRDARAEGYREGHARGHAEGRADAIAELAEVFRPTIEGVDR